ncbi:MAG: phosphoribosyl-ATP diphosphatase [Lachnospiraceae bacterium]|jgi:phosphoribosyl-ATP pyrophosphohydrolase/phosphoribosyl-AMP cyclohydrolase|nr:phosphoribosyl-ATP diphosphatase [Lachnospiraceae bacterium]
MKGRRKLIPTIYLAGDKAVKSIENKEELEIDPSTLAKKYEKDGGDYIMVFDLSKSDEDHKLAVEEVRKIVGKVKLSIFAGGNIKRLEDIKNLIHVGVKAVVLNFSKSRVLEFLDEAKIRFGRERIIVSLPDFDTLYKNQELINENFDMLLFMNEPDIKSVVHTTDLKSIIMTYDQSEEELQELLKNDSVFGLAGDKVNDFSYKIKELKDKILSDESLDEIELIEYPIDNTDIGSVLLRVFEKVQDRKFNPKDGTYTSDLFAKGEEAILRRIGEEVIDIYFSSKNNDIEDIKFNLTDFLYHAIALMVEKGITWDDLAKELLTRL